jgi:hypothetical protein
MIEPDPIHDGPDAARLQELLLILAFIENFADVREFFDQNGSRSIYT